MRKSKATSSLEHRPIKNPLEYSYKKHFSKLPLSFFRDLTDYQKLIWRALHGCSCDLILKKSKHKSLKLEDFKRVKTEKKVEMSAVTKKKIELNLVIPIGKLDDCLNFLGKGSVIFIVDSSYKNNRIKN